LLIRPYDIKDKTRLLEIFRANSPAFFDPKEITDFENFLSDPDKYYYVGIEDKQIKGAGGFHYTGEKSGRLSWYLFDPDSQNKGYGKKMVQHSINEMQKIRKLEKIIVWTSQLTERFYTRFGFQTIEIKKDFWADGLDLYRMEMDV
jgi:[ribosomal protein S18]-alanine N-acetyltransferase